MTPPRASRGRLTSIVGCEQFFFWCVPRVCLPSTESKKDTPYPLIAIFSNRYIPRKSKPLRGEPLIKPHLAAMGQWCIPLPRLPDLAISESGMQEYDLDYDVQEVRLLDHVFKVTTVANEALPLEMLMQLQERRSGNAR